MAPGLLADKPPGAVDAAPSHAILQRVFRFCSTIARPASSLRRQSEKAGATICANDLGRETSVI
jgi:hypothetical protein